MIVESYYNQLLNNYVWTDDWENDCKSKKMDKKKCLLKIKDMFTNEQRSMPIKRSAMCMIIDNPKNVSMTTFSTHQKLKYEIKIFNFC